MNVIVISSSLKGPTKSQYSGIREVVVQGERIIRPDRDTILVVA